VLLLWMCATSNFQEFEHHPDPRTAPPSCLGHCHAAPPLPIAPAWLRSSSTLASVPLHDPANSHLHRVSPLADVHRTQHEDLGLSPRPSGGPKSVEARLAIPSLRRRDLTFRACDFRANCALSCSGRSRGARATRRRGWLAAAITSFTSQKVHLGRVSHGAALCGSQDASRPCTAESG